MKKIKLVDLTIRKIIEICDREKLLKDEVELDE